MSFGASRLTHALVEGSRCLRVSTMGSRNVSKNHCEKGAVSGSCLSELKARQASKIAEIRKALIAAGYDTITTQAAVLGLSRSTAWAVLRGKHKSSGLTTSVINRILRSQDLPPTARRIVDEYVQEKLGGAYGHSEARLRQFRVQLGYPTHTRASLQR
jgi:hypothetical protein